MSQRESYPQRKMSMDHGRIMQKLREGAMRRVEVGDHPLALGRMYPPHINPVEQLEVQAIRVAIERRRG